MKEFSRTTLIRSKTRWNQVVNISENRVEQSYNQYRGQHKNTPNNASFVNWNYHYKSVVGQIPHNIDELQSQLSKNPLPLSELGTELLCFAQNGLKALCLKLRNYGAGLGIERRWSITYMWTGSNTWLRSQRDAENWKKIQIENLFP